MKHSVANVPSQQAVKLEVLGPLVSVSNVAVDCIWETSGNEKWGELGKIAIGDGNTRAVPQNVLFSRLLCGKLHF